LTADLSKSLCGLLHHIMNIPNNRIYIEFSDVEPGMWGWNGETF
jgi:phenylpyruvate tautomerase PptA (4-oxalocrotonate tautomerase family)